MTLKEYLSLNQLSLQAFADRCGLSAPTVLRIRDGKNIPSRRTLTAIVQATQGQVSIQDLISVEAANEESGSDER